MRFTTVVLLAVLVIIGCENPQDLSSEHTLYKGRLILEERASFVQVSNSLSKDSDGLLILGDELPEGTVYGLVSEEEVYAAAGGEVLPEKSWVGNANSEPVEVSLTSNLTLKFEILSTVTIIEAVDMIYIDADGDKIVFSGSGVITTTEISTGRNGRVTLLSSSEFSIGGGGGEWG